MSTSISEGGVCAPSVLMPVPSRGRASPGVHGREAVYAALPGCHRNEQKEVGGWKRRRVGRREGRRGSGGGELTSAFLALPPERARSAVEGTQEDRAPSPGARRPPAGHHGGERGQPAPPAQAWPSRGSVLLPAPGLVPRGAQVGVHGVSWRWLRGEWALGSPSFCQQHWVASRGPGQWVGGEHSSEWVLPLLPFLSCTSAPPTTVRSGLQMPPPWGSGQGGWSF